MENMSDEDKYDNSEERRNLRFQYRQLIHNTERNQCLLSDFQYFVDQIIITTYLQVNEDVLFF